MVSLEAIGASDSMATTMTVETSLKSVVKEYLDLKGIFHYSLLQGLGCYPGLSDIVMHFHGVHYLEVKTAKGKLSPNQLKFQAQCEMDKIPYSVIRRLEDIESIVEGGKR